VGIVRIHGCNETLTPTHGRQGNVKNVDTNGNTQRWVKAFSGAGLARAGKKSNLILGSENVENRFRRGNLELKKIHIAKTLGMGENGLRCPDHNVSEDADYHE